MIREKEDREDCCFGKKLPGQQFFIYLSCTRYFRGFCPDVAGVHDERCATRRFCKNSSNARYDVSAFCLLLVAESRVEYNNITAEQIWMRVQVFRGSVKRIFIWKKQIGGFWG